MNIDFIYQSVYLIICTFLLTNSFKLAKRPMNAPYTYSLASFGSNNLLLITALIIILGCRNILVGSDTCQYELIYHYYCMDGFVLETKLDENPLFNYLMFFCGQNHFPIKIFFTIIAAIYFSCISLACRKLFPDNSYIMFLSYLVAFSTFSYGTNGIKAGVGASIFLVAVAFSEKKWLSIILAILSYGFHHSMIMVIYAYLISIYFKRTDWFFVLWVVSFFIALLHISWFQELFASYADERGSKYLNGQIEDSYITGFRLDFILYSAAPVVVGYITLYKRMFHNEKYELLLRLYLFTNSVWMLCMYASFTNRIAYLSWFLLPIVLLYPYYACEYKNDQLLIGKQIATYHLMFTLFMTFIFYPLAKNL